MDKSMIRGIKLKNNQFSKDIEAFRLKDKSATDTLCVIKGKKWSDSSVTLKKK